jgi:hypothetical protein
MKQPVAISAIAGALFTLPFATAFAKPAKDRPSGGTYGCARFDLNANGILDPSEKESLLKAFSEGDPALKLLDTNNDGKLDETELATIELPQPKKKKKKGA